MKIDTVNFGQIEIEKDKIIEFKDGIPGFQDEKEFVVILNEDPDNPFHYLQSVNMEELSFVIMNPFEVFSDYEIVITDLVKEKLEIENEEQIAIYSIVVIPEDMKKMTTNLQGPIVINVDNNMGKQVILDDGRYTTKHYLIQEKPAKAEI